MNPIIIFGGKAMLWRMLVQGGAMRIFLTILFPIVLVGCTQGQWVKDGVTEQIAKQDRDACLREAQELAVGTQVNAYGGQAHSIYITNQKLYDACIAARGYSYRQLP